MGRPRLAGWKFLAGRIHYSGQSWNNCGIGVRGVPPGGDTGNGCSGPRVVDQRVEDGSQTTSTGAEAMEWSGGESGWSRCQEARRPKQWRRGQRSRLVWAEVRLRGGRKRSIPKGAGRFSRNTRSPEVFVKGYQGTPFLSSQFQEIVVGGAALSFSSPAYLVDGGAQGNNSPLQHIFVCQDSHTERPRARSASSILALRSAQVTLESLAPVAL